MPPCRPESREGDNQRRNTLFLTRTDWVLAAVFVVSLVVLVPFTLMGYEFARRVLFDGIGLMMGFGAAEILVRAIGRKKKLGFFLVLTGIAWIMGLFLLLFLPDAGWRSLLFEVGERVPLYLFVGGFVSGLADAGMDLVWGPSTAEEAREQRRYYLRQELKTFLVVVGALAAIFGFFFVLYVLGTYVLSPILRYFL